jgi:heat-inducible transcriptional repressor
MSVVPIKGRAEIKNIQLVSTGKYTVIVIMVTSLGIIKNKLVRCEYEFSLKVLSVFQNILQKSFQGREISQVDSKYAEKIINSLDENVALFILPFVKAVVYLAKESASADVTLVGQSNLFFFPELDTKSMRQTVDFLNSTNDILDFLMQYQNEDIRVLIGEESGLHGLYNMSFIISKCKLPPSEEGMIALIGPTRMDYARIIPIVRYLSDTITEIINQILGL